MSQTLYTTVHPYYPEVETHVNNAIMQSLTRQQIHEKIRFKEESVKKLVIRPPGKEGRFAKEWRWDPEQRRPLSTH